MTLVTLCGTIAAICTTSSFLPQIFKIRKQGGKDLSYGMLSVFLTGVLLWLVYGIAVQAAAIIWANGITGLLIGVAIVLKATHKPGATAGKARRPRLAVDMDEVIADVLPYHLRLFNEATGHNFTAEMIAEKGMTAIPSELKETFWSFAYEPDFFAELDVMEGSQRALQLLSEHFEIFIVTAAMEVPTSFNAKYRWLKRHFPFIPDTHIVFCGSKSIIDADYLVDDRPRNFVNFSGTGILFTAPHNAREKAPLRADNWQQVVEILLGPQHQKAPEVETVSAEAASVAFGQ